MIKAVLFDLDGTLADTAPDLSLALNRLLEEQGRSKLPLATTRPWTSSGARGMLKIGFGIDPEHPEFERLRIRFLDLYESGRCIDSRLFPGMEELLPQIEKRGVRWGVVTNKSQRFTVPLIDAMGLGSRAACVVSGDTTAYPKPHPMPLLHAAKLIGVPADDCLYVGDDLRDVQSARAAGMPVIAAAFGYLGEGGKPDEWGADGVINDPIETLNYLGAPPSV